MRRIQRILFAIGIVTAVAGFGRDSILALLGGMMIGFGSGGWSDA